MPDLDWNPHESISRLKPTAWSGRVWRFHNRRFEPTDPGGSRIYSGRYHRAPNRFAVEDTWPALYLAMAPETALAEVLRHMRPDLIYRLNEYRLSEIEVTFRAVLDCRDTATLGVSQEKITNDFEFTVTQMLASAAIRQGAEAILVPSATDLGDNLVVFPDQLDASSNLTVVSSRDPRLYVQR